MKNTNKKAKIQFCTLKKLFDDDIIYIKCREKNTFYSKTKYNDNYELTSNKIENQFKNEQN